MMSVLWILLIIAWSVLPYRELSVWIVGSQGFNLGDLVLLAVLVPVLASYGRWGLPRTLGRALLILWVVILVCAVKSVMGGEGVREVGRVLRGAAFWVLLPAVPFFLRSRRAFNSWLRGMTVILLFAAVSLVAFSIDPALIPAGEETGTFRNESYGGVERVFTLGMWGVFAGAIIILARLALHDRGRWAGAAIAAALLGSLVVTFARTLFAGLLLGMFILLFLIHRRAGTAVALGTAVLALGGFLAALQDVSPLGEAVAARVLDLAAVPDAAWQTYVWRLAEAETALGSLRSTTDHLFGAMGRVYGLEDGYTASVPHIGIVGFYTCYGVIGAIAYAGFLVLATGRLVSTVAAARGAPWFWVPAGTLAAWVALLATGAAAPLFHFGWGTATLAVTFGMSEAARRLFPTNAYASPHHIHRHTLPERGAAPPGDGGERPRTGLPGR